MQKAMSIQHTSRGEGGKGLQGGGAEPAIADMRERRRADRRAAVRCRTKGEERDDYLGRI